MINNFSVAALALPIILAGMISVGWGISISIAEIALGIIAGGLNLLQPESWMTYIASVGGMVLTFPAGTEIDISIMKDNIYDCLAIGMASFGMPFILVFFYWHI